MIRDSIIPVVKFCYIHKCYPHLRGGENTEQTQGDVNLGVNQNSASYAVGPSGL